MGRYSLDKNGEKRGRKGYERTCKYGCGYYIDIKEDRYIKIKNNCFHFDCYVSHLTKLKNSIPYDDALIEAEKMAEKTHKENFEKANEAKEDSEFSSWLMMQYGLMVVSARVHSVLNKVYGGNYRNMRSPIPKDHLRDMWKQKMPYLNRVAERNRVSGKNIIGDQRIMYDLAILINKYDDYLNWLEKNRVKADVSTDNSASMTENNVYNNLVAVKQVKNEQQDDVDEWF